VHYHILKIEDKHITLIGFPTLTDVAYVSFYNDRIVISSKVVNNSPNHYKVHIHEHQIEDKNFLAMLLGRQYAGQILFLKYEQSYYETHEE
jgi:hypothetical protein